MAVTKTQIANKAMVDLGEALLTDVDTDGTNPANVVNEVWDVILSESLNHGPEEGWKFARRRYHGIDRDEITITALADLVTGSTTTVTGTHTLLAGDKVTLTDTNIDDTYDVNSVSTTVSFAIDAVFTATDTGTGYWTSDEYAYRFARPTCTRVTSVQVGGVEITDWIREGSYILTNQDDTEVDMRYILHADDVTIANFPPHFVDVLWRRLSAALAYDLVQNAALSNTKLQALEQVYLPRAIGMDNREQYEKETDTSWVDAGR